MEKRAGFTLIELMIAMAIAAVVLAGVYMSYVSQQKSYVIQDQVSAMQQNLRAAMDMMERDIRMAGLDPIDGIGAGNFGIISATNASLQFTEDLNGSGVTVVDNNENITFTLQASGTGTFDLVRTELNTPPSIVANNMRALAFAYAYDADADGILDFVDNDADGQCDVEEIIWATVVPVGQIRAVRIWLLARTDRPIQGYVDTKTYVVGSQNIIPAGADRNHMHRLLTTTVRCRNLQ